jgi:hypothetical protein
MPFWLVSMVAGNTSVWSNVRLENSDELGVKGDGVSDPKQQDPDSMDPAPAWLRERNNDPVPLARLKDQDWPALRKLDETVAQLRAMERRDSQARKPPDLFAEAVAKAMQEQLEPEFVEAPSVLQSRQSFGTAARFAVAAAALVALVFAFPASQEAALSALTAWQPTWQPTWQSLKSSSLAAPQPQPAPTLIGRDGSGSLNEPPPLVVNVNSPGPGTTVPIERMPASVATAPPAPAAPTPQQQQQPVASPPSAAASPPSAARAEPPMREIDPNEVAAFVKRAQELLATGDLQAARLLLLRAAEAHDARAALALAKTFDPIVSKQFAGADPERDLAQARNWYQKADEWGAPEAQRQLDALASYTR